ncbi:hypothetical protein BRADI_3g30165v3 [Brachypodium distachyon]|uniref:Uncharacterized protein n=1 Tax=Brachypodium distachyon TaxID=15368 RepID=A0A0Q3FDS4_BRADI|nr:hypothetical protein BRADI_3g30165v3 [Brachypodium distachyon]
MAASRAHPRLMAKRVDVLATLPCLSCCTPPARSPCGISGASFQSRLLTHCCDWFRL